MTDEERDEMERKHKEIMEWAIEENDRIYHELKNQGRIIGMDGFYPEMCAATQKYHRKLNELLSEYGFPPIDFSRYDDAVRQSLKEYGLKVCK